MKIASITITSDRHKIIGDALRSVSDLVDLMVFVDIGIELETMKIIKEIAGDRAVFVKSDVLIDDISVWRNLGLTVASNFGADWALMLDTDERMNFNGVDVRPILESSDVNVFAVRNTLGNYTRERFFRLPAHGKYVYSYHEMWDGDPPALIPGVTFSELPKTEEQMRANLERFGGKLDDQIAEDPTNHRWLYYKALHLMAKEQHRDAALAFMGCLSAEAPSQVYAWDCYMRSRCLASEKLFSEALGACLDGLGRFPIPECAWMAGVQCLLLGRPQEALSWANMAIANGLYAGASVTANRVGNAEPYALWEGPFELQLDCMKAMGYPEESIGEHMNLIQEVKKARES